jgi:ribosomal protein S18 acetylase RimI-like enzyme
MLSILGGATFFETYAGFVLAADMIAGVEKWHPPQVYRRWIDAPTAEIWIAEVKPDDVAIGYVVLLTDEPTGDAPLTMEIKRIYLLHRFHGTGLGKRLMSAAIEAARRRQATRLHLDVAEFNEHAISFYTRFGFRIAHTGQIVTPTNSYPLHTLALALTASAPAD